MGQHFDGYSKTILFKKGVKLIVNMSDRVKRRIKKTTTLNN